MGITRNNRHKRRATGGKKKHYRKNRKFEMGRQPTNTKMGERKTSLVRMRGGSMKVRAIRLDAGNFSWASEGMGRKARILGVTYNATSNELVRTNTLVKNAIIQVDAAPFRLWYEQHYGIKLVKKKLGAKKGAKPAAPTGKKVAKPAAGAKKGAKTAAKGAAKTAGTKKPVAKTTEKKVEETTDKKPLSKAAQTVAAALVKRYKLSIRKRAKLVAKWRRLNRELVREKRQLTKFEKKVKTLKAGRKSFAEKLANRTKRAQHFIAKRQGVRRARMVNKKIDSHLLDQFQTGRLYACIASRPGQDGCADGYILEGKELEFYIKKMKK